MSLEIVKFFVWKPCNNLLPTKENFFKKWMVKDSLCPICEAEVENMSHFVVMPMSLWFLGAGQ
jgi:hypothetical protein